MPTLSFHAAEQTERAVRTLATQQGVKVSALVGQLVEEGLLMRRFPGLVFRDGPTGRRAAIAGSLDVWEIIALVQDHDEDEQTVLAAYPSLTPAALKTARAYAAAYPQEIAARITLSHLPEEEVRETFPTLFAPSPPRLPRGSSRAGARTKRRRERSRKR